MTRHILLIGLPGAGKTTVAELVAKELGAPFVDVDYEVERKSGRTVAEIFKHYGESVFRDFERAVMSIELRKTPRVIATGGGWAAQPGNIDAVVGDPLIIYLEIDPVTAATRATADDLERPLLGSDPVDRIAELLEIRKTFYERAHTAVDAVASVETVAGEVAALARAEGGW